MNEQKLVYTKGTVFSTKQEEKSTFILLNDVFLADEKVDSIYIHKIHRPYQSHVYRCGKVILMSSYLFDYCNLVVTSNP